MTDQTTEALAEGIARSRDTDYLDMEALLSDEEKDLLVKVRKFGDKELLPIVNDYWERGSSPSRSCRSCASSRSSATP